ncbi:hypothetical protein F5883DRAFT_588016 [Diaporthe sp. PMI_573]|nr:hypothetical protein F5883DRAFT_588016 [Diaporthaceae sp. PMI_573]
MFMLRLHMRRKLLLRLYARSKHGGQWKVWNLCWYMCLWQWVVSTGLSPAAQYWNPRVIWRESTSTRDSCHRNGCRETKHAMQLAHDGTLYSIEHGIEVCQGMVASMTVEYQR